MALPPMTSVQNVYEVAPVLPVPSMVPIVPAQMPIGEMITGAVGVSLMVMFDPLSLPLMDGLSFTTRILYPLPAIVPTGMVALMGDVPLPMMEGVAKFPFSSDSSAENVPVKVPVLV